MKKYVDQTSHDSRVVTTTYKGTHNHGSSSNNMYMPVLDLPFQNIEQRTTQTQLCLEAQDQVSEDDLFWE